MFLKRMALLGSVCLLTVAWQGFFATASEAQTNSRGANQGSRQESTQEEGQRRQQMQRRGNFGGGGQFGGRGRGGRGGAEADNSLIVGELAPDFLLKSLDGKSETKLSDFRGDKPVILFFGSYT